MSLLVPWLSLRLGKSLTFLSPTPCVAPSRDVARLRRRAGCRDLAWQLAVPVNLSLFTH